MKVYSVTKDEDNSYEPDFMIQKLYANKHKAEIMVEIAHTLNEWNRLNRQYFTQEFELVEDRIVDEITYNETPPKLFRLGD